MADFLQQLEGTWAQMKEKAKEIERLQNERKKTEDLLNDATGSIHRLEIENGDLRSSLEEARRSLKDKSTEVSKAQEAVQHANAEKTSIQQELYSLQSQYTELVENYESDKQEYLRLKREYDDQGSSIASKLEAKDKELASMKHALDEERAKAAAHQNQYLGHVQGLEKEKSDLNRHIMNLMEELRQTEKKTTAFETECVHTKTKLKEVEQEKVSGTEPERSPWQALKPGCLVFWGIFCLFTRLPLGWSCPCRRRKWKRCKRNWTMP